MDYMINKDRTRLTLYASAKERRELRKLGEVQSDEVMREFLEPLVSNSELQWIYPVNTGDLTDAPMLGILGNEMRDDRTPQGYRGPKVYTGPGMIQPILERFAFMDYQVRSLLEDLRDTGRAVLVGGGCAPDAAKVAPAPASAQEGAIR